MLVSNYTFAKVDKVFVIVPFRLCIRKWKICPSCFAIEEEFTCRFFTLIRSCQPNYRICTLRLRSQTFAHEPEKIVCYVVSRSWL